jgi:hypothetical protein
LGFGSLRLKGEASNVVRKYESRCAAYQNGDYKPKEDIRLPTKAGRALIKTFCKPVMLLGLASRMTVCHRISESASNRSFGVGRIGIKSIPVDGSEISRSALLSSAFSVIGGPE